jgi:hypothetical protein
MLEHALFCVDCLALNWFALKILSRKGFGKLFWKREIK